MSSPGWIRWLPWVSVGAFSLLWCARWPAFPLVLDPCYHLLIAQQVAEAGGPIVYEWWEYAPVGRPHLYPPLLHLLLAGLLKAGCAPLFVIRLASAVLPPALLLTLFLTMRRLFGPSLALACLWAGLLPFAFHLHTAVTMAGTLGMMELLWLLVALEEGRPVAAGLWLALLCYTHLGLPMVALATIGCAAALRPQIRLTLAKASWGFGLAIPWSIHLLRSRAVLHVVARSENATADLLPALAAFALVGLWRCWRLRGRWSWLPACWVGFGLLLPHHLYRWLSGEGVLPVLALAGSGIDWSARWLCRWGPGSRDAGVAGSERRHILAGLGVFLVLVCSPGLIRAPSGWRWAWPDSAPWHLVNAPWVAQKALEASLATPPIERLVSRVEAASAPTEILWANAPYALGLVAALAHRPMSSAMLNEVSPARPFDPLRAAHLIVWFKFAPLPGAMTREQVSRYPLTPVSDDAFATLLRQAGVPHTVRAPQAVVPLWVALAWVGAALAVIVWDMR